MSEQTEQFKKATEAKLTVIEEPTPAPDDEHSEELPQEIKDGIQKIIINDLVNKLDEQINKKVAEKVQCEKCGKSMSKHSLKYTHKCGSSKTETIKKVKTDTPKDLVVEEPPTPKAIARTVTTRSPSEDDLVIATVAIEIGDVNHQLLLDGIQSSIEKFKKNEIAKTQKKAINI